MRSTVWRPYRGGGLETHSYPSEGVVAEEGLTTPPESCLPVRRTQTGAGVCEEMGKALPGVDVSPVYRAGTGRRLQSLSGLALFACLLPT